MKRTSMTRTISVAAGAVLGLSVLAVPPAAAEPDGPSSAELAAASAAVDDTGVDGIAWHTDETTGTVVVRTDSTVTAAERERLRQVADTVEVRPTDGVFDLRLAPGDAIYGPDYRCSMAFNVSNHKGKHLLTAGHCGEEVETWYADEDGDVLVGSTVAASYPSNDFAVVRYENQARERPGGFTAGKAEVGLEATRDGTASGEHSGEVTAINVSVKYEGGVAMHGMIEADICSEPGDSGGALYTGSTALGITSGGSGDCSSGGISFYQPIIEVLAAYNVELD
ncbi:S1 family peptidase [Promicromonospora citrea]|uniref:Serine protease n=1 Tax=Promicromonospora citrea TaxID=43677 RepID=A0A8H9GLP4_9MICO|nr:S1 family peptidase [Promicromonospora citrea]NNH51535.1 trypsin-like serine protease [Promicromonospora citrea]GGM37912.1 serine protease [Promicromonospora citrea]